MILITGQPRGGLSLVWRLLTAAGFRLAFEPLNPWNRMPDDWATRYEGAKQPWSDYLGDGYRDFSKIIRVRRECMDTCYSQWARDTVRQEPEILVPKWRDLDESMDEKIPHAFSLDYAEMCEEPERIMGEVITWLGGTGTIDEWAKSEPPAWFHREYDTTQIHAAASGLWRDDPAWAQWQ